MRPINISRFYFRNNDFFSIFFNSNGLEISYINLLHYYMDEYFHCTYCL